MNDQFAATLSLSMRARKLNFGFDTVKKAVQAGEISLLLTASDLSPKTVKEVRFLAEQKQIPFILLDETMSEIGNRIGKKTGVLGVADQGFAKKLFALAGAALSEK